MKPARAAKSRAWRSRSARFSSSDMPSAGGQSWPRKPGVARMWAMLALHAAWSETLCSGPSATSRKAGAVSPAGTAKLSGTKGSVSPGRRPRAACARVGGARRAAALDELLDGAQRAVAQARDRGGARRGQGAAEVVDGDLVAADAPRGVDQAPERVERGAAAGQDHGARLERVQRAAEAAGVQRHREGQGAQAARGAGTARAPGRAGSPCRTARWRRRRARPPRASPGVRRASPRPASRWPSATRSRTRGRRPRRRDRGSRRRAAAPPRRCARPSARRGSPPARGRRRPRRSARRRCAGATAWPGPAPRSRARATAEEMLWVSSKAERSASISLRSNWRWPPAVRRGSG